MPTIDIIITISILLQALPLGDTLGRILAHDVTASEPLPPFPASIKVGPHAQWGAVIM